MKLNIKGYEFGNANEAIQHINASGKGVAISIGNKIIVTEEKEANRIASMNVQFAYIIDHEMADGTYRIVSVPVN